MRQTGRRTEGGREALTMYPPVPCPSRAPKVTLLVRDRQTGSETDRQTDKQTDRRTDRQTDRRTVRQTDRQTDGQ